jgi:hypothetical protein
MKPIPETTCAATRDGSRTTRPFARMSMNPYFDTSIIRAAETPTGMGSEARALLANLPFHAHYGGQDESERQLRELQSTLAG